MPLDGRARRFLDALAATGSPGALAQSVTDRRQALAQLLELGGPKEPVGAITEGFVPGPAGPIRVRRYDPPDAGLGPFPGIVYLHGGGLVAGSLDTHDGIARALASAARCRLLSVDYRLAPEAPFPAALDDVVATLAHVLRHPDAFGMDARIGVCGDSAGGTLAAVACQDLVGASGVAPRLQVLLCPIMDYAGRSPSRLEFATGHFLDESTLDHDLRYYLPAGTDPADPRVSPLRAVGPLPRIPTIIHTAEFDPLRDEGARYAERLTGAGATVAYTCHAGMIHLFYGLGGVIPRARVALAGIGAELGAALRAAGPERALAPAP